MNNQNLIIYEFDELYKVLFEIKKDINLNLKKASKNDISELNSQLDCLIFTQNKISGLDNQIIFDKFPISISGDITFLSKDSSLLEHLTPSFENWNKL